jgi:hypothetical protein
VSNPSAEIADSYQAWMERMMGGRDSKPAEVGDVVQTPAGAPFDAVEFAKTERSRYVGEVGKKLGDFVFHFFPLAGQQFPQNFEERMSEAFLEVFKFEDRVQSTFTPELNSWAVKAIGFATNPMADDLALRVFPALDKRLE